MMIPRMTSDVVLGGDEGTEEGERWKGGDHCTRNYEEKKLHNQYKHMTQHRSLQTLQGSFSPPPLLSCVDTKNPQNVHNSLPN